MPDFKALLAQLKPRHQRVVEAYLSIGTWAGAAREVGCSKATALRVGKAAKATGILEAAAGEIADRGIVSLEGMIAQFDQDRDFAIETKNATAAVRSSELKAKIAGYLMDRSPKDAGGNQFVVYIGLPPRGAADPGMVEANGEGGRLSASPATVDIHPSPDRPLELDHAPLALAPPGEDLATGERRTDGLSPDAIGPAIAARLTGG